ncbi:uncharacterized protein LACBIDRAFT_329810 [Laccaria bicolor S238N-H82]|uniref:Predicted protein n=1 Tax=Laccaria bicolor (strain S238N-H82 / ATCC MYA-4686) TaxID=486041 RepID=B0DJB0_LACBS|nr:uncharacterized protein LACBIDRAFT_329810 [Laccaria bicolor S238N-H82]EDR05372.1 predicted protein [Laccaria bicolor S238N-H82]|eukprot:XP_001883930.1 predicted protein [Laccaria bicolor S238N-H82]
MANRNTIHHPCLIHRVFRLASDDAECFEHGDDAVAYVSYTATVITLPPQSFSDAPAQVTKSVNGWFHIVISHTAVKDSFRKSTTGSLRYRRVNPSSFAGSDNVLGLQFCGWYALLLEVHGRTASKGTED